jgi:hypothetical protein
MIGAVQDDLAAVAILLHFEDGVSLDDSRVIQVQTVDFGLHVGPNRFRELKMPSGNPHWYINVRDLHMAYWFMVAIGGLLKGAARRSRGAHRVEK